MQNNNNTKPKASLNADNFTQFTHEELWAEIERLKKLSGEQSQEIKKQGDNTKITQEMFERERSAKIDAQVRCRKISEAVKLANVEAQVGKLLLLDIGNFQGA